MPSPTGGGHALRCERTRSLGVVKERRESKSEEGRDVITPFDFTFPNFTLLCSGEMRGERREERRDYV